MKRSPCLFAILCLALLGQATFAATKPNIILMMADDMGMGDTSAFQDFTGNADAVQLHTPEMDRLARMGVRFTDAHTPSSRCSPTRYGLLTGRYPWRNRLKHWVLFGVQGDPMIEADRPTIASMLRDNGYRTAMFGKWHVGLRYRQSNGKPAAAWDDADLTKPMYTTPVDHGFDIAYFTSRSHATSGPDAGKKANPKPGKKAKKPRKPKQGPGHVHGRNVVGATGNGKELVQTGEHAYVLKKLGSRHSDHAMSFLNSHVSDKATRDKPFFLYYPANSNHGPYTPDQQIGGKAVAGAARTKAGQPMDARHDYIYENDVALGRMLDWLAATNDPRQPGKKLIETTLVIFTSDNGAEKNSNTATGPFRSHKGSVYEGGHRVPFIVSWPAGGIGDGDASSKGLTNRTPIGLIDLYATFAEILGDPLPDLRAGRKGAEDSHSVLAAFKGKRLAKRPPMFFNDHSQAKGDRAAAAVRVDAPIVNGKPVEGQWKLFFTADLLRRGIARPYELYDLANDPQEKTNRVREPRLKSLIQAMSQQATFHRNAGGHRLAAFATTKQHVLNFRPGEKPAIRVQPKTPMPIKAPVEGTNLVMTLYAKRGNGTMSHTPFDVNHDGLGLRSSHGTNQIDGREAIVITFNRDVIVDSLEIIAGNNGTCGGFYRVGNAAPLAIYCIDGDIDSQDQSGLLSDIGVLKAGEKLILDSSRHFGVEAAGSWRLGSLRIRELK